MKMFMLHFMGDKGSVKIVLVYPDLLLHRPDWPGYFYAGIGSLSAVLKREGHETSLIHITKLVNRSDFIKRVQRERPDLIGFSSTSHMFPFVKEMASWLVESKIRVPTICGGIHPTIAPEESIAADGIDMICRGEGEGALIELCQKMKADEDITRIPNLWIKREGEIIQSPLRPLIDDLDALPFPDRSIFNYPSLYGEREGRGSFMVARGCPYQCTYCCNHLVRKIYGNKGKPIRFRGVDHVLAEIKEVLEQYPFIRTLIFDDDILFLQKDWAEEFAERYRKEIGLPFICNARANLTGRTMIALLKKAGCYHVKFGIESGNEYISNTILRRQLTNEQIKKAFALCKEAGLLTESFNMVGIPFETPRRVLDTVKLNAAIAVDKMQVSIYQPYQGTRLGELSKEQGFLISKDLESDFFSPSILKLNTMLPSQTLMFRDYFKVLVRFYQVLGELPANLSKIAIKLSDCLLCSLPVSKVANLIYIPSNYVYRKVQGLKIKAKVRVVRRSTKTCEIHSHQANGVK